MKLQRSIKRMKWAFGMALIPMLLAGCVTPYLKRTTIDDLEKEILAASPTAPEAGEGSLWSSIRFYNPYSDVKARNVGDVVTISVVESARASKNAETKTSRDSGLQASWSGIFDALASRWSVNGQKIGTSHEIDFGNSFDGKGTTTRSSSMTTYITARVTHVLPNGNLVIRGTRQVMVNQENQYISVQGVVRPEDISSSNVVLSTYIAEAVIELSGYGPVSDKQTVGWFSRIVDWIWPF
ncbi:MAG: flagellar basal body L-ring protein FlgH [Thermodesulfobacteriota bacterium]